jgi:transglutaminase-like putative cysteine protease
MAQRSLRQASPLLLPAELALAGITTTAILSMHLLFVDGSFRAPLMLQAAAAHLTVAILRRRGVSLLASGLATAGIAALLITWAQYAQTAWALLPSRGTWSTIRADVDQAWRVFVDVSAPAPVEPGFIVIASVAIWAVAFVADWGAFRSGTSFEALIPAGTLFIFGAVLGEERTAVGSAALFVAAVFTFLLLHRTWRQELTAPWATSGHQRSRPSLLSLGSTLALVAVVGGALVAPRIPGAEEEAVVPWRDISDDEDARIVVSPLVDVRSRLVEQPNVEVFTVRVDEGDGQAPVGAHWRLTALDSFDGTIWRSSYQTNEVDGTLPRPIESGPETRSVRQTITVLALAAIWLPAAYEPVAIDAGGADVDYDAHSSTLIVDRSFDSSDGMEYIVDSTVPHWTAEELRQAPAEIPDGIAQRYLQLPGDFSESIREEALRLTADAPTPYDKAIALMSHLRSFDYTQEPQGGHSVDALERFLFENQRGYCEQFAGAFAAMARSVGIPARVAVGFTKGIQDPNEPTLFRVTGKHAHAWVEVYFEGHGWVTFDPTPGRAPPGAEAWLGVPEAQADEAGDGTVATTVPPGSPSPPAADPQPEGGPSEPPDAAPEVADEAPATTDGDDAREVLPARLRGVMLPIGLGILAYLALVPAALWTQHTLRRRRTRDPAALVRLAWREAGEQVGAVGLALPASATFAERAAQIRAVLPEATAALDELADLSERTLYSPTAPPPAATARLRAISDAIGDAAARRMPWYRRAVHHLDVRRLAPRRPHLRRTTHRVEPSLRPM